MLWTRETQPLNHIQFGFFFCRDINVKENGFFPERYEERDTLTRAAFWTLIDNGKLPNHIA